MAVSKGRSKRTHHKQETDTVNRTAMWIGGGIAVIVLAGVIISVLF